MSRTAPPRVLVLGIAGRTPFAGVAWQVLHYVEGLRRLGCDVFYVEDTGTWPYDAERNTVTDDCGFTLRYLGDLMAWCGLGDRWAYRSGVTGEVFGCSEGELARRIAGADALLNLTGATLLSDEHRRVPVRIYLETDPVLPQIEVAQGRAFTLDVLDAHTHLFTFGENIGQPVCPLPVGRFAYQPTRQPIVLDWWPLCPPPAPDAPFTTVGSWQQSGKDITWEGEVYTWSKHHEFLRLLGLPRRAPAAIELALACDDQAVLDLLHAHGWHTRDALRLSRGILPYRAYIQSSRGEFTVAKDQNVRLRSGWFSDRSACYLASGRPVVTQDTGFGEALPTGQGLFAFADEDGALDALARVQHDYAAHSRAARRIAETHFASDRVLGDLLARAGL